MKKLPVTRISADQAGDYFQVCFDNDEFDDTIEVTADNVDYIIGDYFLIQWGLEFDDADDPPRYIESNDEAYIGHVTVIDANLQRNSFYLKVRHGKNSKEIEISFPDQENEDFDEVERILKIIIPKLVIS
jgi:hypothetical protein